MYIRCMEAPRGCVLCPTHVNPSPRGEPRPGPVAAVHGHGAGVAGPRPALRVGVAVGATFKPCESQEEGGCQAREATKKSPTPGPPGAGGSLTAPTVSPKCRAARGPSAGHGPVGLGRQALSRGGWAGAALAAEDSPRAHGPRPAFPPRTHFLGTEEEFWALP